MKSIPAEQTASSGVSGLSRRDLIRRSATAGLAGATALSLSDSILGASVKPAALDRNLRSLLFQTEGDVIRVGMVGDGTTLDPPNWTNINARHFIPALFDNLIEIDAEFNLVPGLAASWESSADELEWTFHLQPNVLFHDGTPCDAEAVAFNFRRVLDPNNNLRHRANIEIITAVEVVDPLTVKIVLGEPFTPILATITEAVGYISSPAAIEQYGEEYGSHPVGAGPFKLVEWRRDSELALARFDDYWRTDLPRASGVSFLPIPDTAVKLTSLRTGDIEIVDEIATADADSVAGDDSLQLFTLAGSRWPMIRLNTVIAPFDNLALRQAVAHAINRDAIIAAIYFGRGTPAYGPISPLYPAVYDPAIEQNGLRFDLDMARAKLAEGGQPDGFSFSLDIGSTPQVARLAELIQASLTEVGIQLEIVARESAAFTERLRSKEFQAALGSWTPRPDVDGIIYQHFHTAGLANWVSYSNPELDTLLDQTRTTPPGNERNELFRQAERIVAQEVPWVFLVFEELNRAARVGVANYTITADTLLQLRDVALDGAS
ncbi:MAG: ABC transporter substrate-binding protein [Thermomicrobiales bacterium]|nr:ABC transporter substrate-binding protein [Thermomicrobiales bacterium]